MTAVNGMRALLDPLVGESIWGLRRSHGSCFLAEWGAAANIHALPSRNLGSGRSTPAQRVPTGKWSLLVENCAWRIEGPNDVTSHLDEDHLHMQGVMDQLERQVVTRVALDEAALTLVFSGGGMMRLGPAAPIDPHEVESQWMLTLPDGRHLTRDTAGNLSLE